VPAATFRRTWSECVELLDLQPLLNKPARQLSLGQRMRCDLAAALLHAPPILFLDEPTIGLDVAVKARIRQFIKRLNREHGVTVLLTSHDLDDIEDLCSRLVMIDQGQIVFDGPLQAIKQAFGNTRTLHLFLQEAAPDALTTAQRSLPELALSDVQQAAPQELTVRVAGAQLSAGIIASRLLNLLPIYDLRIEEPSVENIVRQLYEGQLAWTGRSV
jgi:ABC-2 type transport system ATP-binding protein